jgi:hypothetical protein
VLVTRAAGRDLPDEIELLEVGDVSLKGVADPVGLYSAKRAARR